MAFSMDRRSAAQLFVAYATKSWPAGFIVPMYAEKTSNLSRHQFVPDLFVQRWEREQVRLRVLLPHDALDSGNNFRMRHRHVALLAAVFLEVVKFGPQLRLF